MRIDWPVNDTRCPHCFQVGEHHTSTCGTRVRPAETKPTAVELNPIEKATQVFNTYAAMGGPDVPAEPWSALQVRLVRWVHQNFGGCNIVHQTLGVCEEAGELAHAVLKHEQGIRGLTSQDAYRAEAGDAVADAVIYLMQVCTALRLDFGTLVTATAENVMRRDWKRNPKDADEKTDGAMDA